MNLLDGIILILLAAGALSGYRRGLIGAAASFLGFLGGIWLAGHYYIPLAGILEQRLGLEELFTRILFPFCAGIPVSGGEPLLNPVPGADVPGFPPSLWEPVQALNLGIGGVAIARTLAESLVKLLAFFLIYALASFTLGSLAGFLGGICTRIAGLFLLGGVNRLGGLALGLVTSALFVAVAVGMLTPFIFGLTLGLPAAEGLRQALLNNWNASLLIPYFTRSWGAIALVLARLFRMV